MTETVSEQLVEQRVRNRVIEYLELAASADKQRAYERDVPIAWVPVEMIEMWRDQVQCANIEAFLGNVGVVYLEDERVAIRAFHSVWQATSDGTPNPMPASIEELLGTAVWTRFVEAAQIASCAFVKRGRFRRI